MTSSDAALQAEKVTLVPNTNTGEFSQPLRWSDALALTAAQVALAAV